MLLLALACVGVPALAQEPGAEAIAEAAAEAATEQLDIRADSVEFETDRAVYVMRGNVRIQKGETSILADWVVFSNRTRQGVATGNVTIEEGEDRLAAESLHFELDELSGIIYEGKLGGPDADFQMAGSRIKRVETQRYLFDDAVFTTCNCPDGERIPWQLRSETADIDVEGYATTRNTKLDILEVPALWTPWLRYPLGQDRQTGFLFPTIQPPSSRTGFIVGLPFFWAAHEQINLTVEPKYLGTRGFKPEALGEYVFGLRSGGSLFGSFISDDEIDEDNPSTPFSKNRWGIEWIHEQHLPAGFVWKVDSRFASDNNYPFDFRDFERFRTDRFLESTTFVENRFGPMDRYGFTATIDYADDLSAPDDLDRDDVLVHRMPNLMLSSRPVQVGPLENVLGALDVRYTHFWAIDEALDALPEAEQLGLDNDAFLDVGIDGLPDGRERNADGNIVGLDGTVELRDGTIVTADDLLAGFDMMDPDVMGPLLDPDGSQDNFPLGFEGDGQFQEGEPLADRGHRIVLNPRILLPFRVADAVEILPEFGWMAFLYSTDNQSTTIRNLFHANIDVRTQLARRLDVPWFGALRHVVEPYFKYTVLTEDSSSDDPLFIPRPFVQNQRLRLFDPVNIVRDPSDRAEGVNGITLGVRNAIYLPGVLDEEGISGGNRLLAEFGAGFYNDFEEDSLRALYFEGQLFPFFLTNERYNFRTRFHLGFDLDELQLNEALFEFGWASLDGHDFRITYRFVENVPRFFENFGFDDERFDDFEDGFLRVNQFSLNTRIAITRHIGITYRIAYSFEQSLVIANQIGVEYLSRCYCWALGVAVSDNRARGLTPTFQYRFFGLSKDTVRPFVGEQRRTRRADNLFD